MGMFVRRDCRSGFILPWRRYRVNGPAQTFCRRNRSAQQNRALGRFGICTTPVWPSVYGLSVCGADSRNREPGLRNFPRSSFWRQSSLGAGIVTPSSAPSDSTDSPPSTGATHSPIAIWGKISCNGRITISEPPW